MSPHGDTELSLKGFDLNRFRFPFSHLHLFQHTIIESITGLLNTITTTVVVVVVCSLL